MAKYCPKCGEVLIDSAKFCKSCGFKLDEINKEPQTNFTPEAIEHVEKSYTVAIILGYVFSILIPLISLVIAIYLLTRKDSSSASKHGKYIMIITVVLFIFSAVGFFIR